MATQNVPDQGGPEDIPALSNMAHSIFVPTDRDFTKTPPPLSDDPVAREEITIEALEWHAARVDENMILIMAREAERVQRLGQVERVHYDWTNRPITHQQRNMDHGLLLEEILLREDEEAVMGMLRDAKYRDNDDVGHSREGPRERERRPHHRSHSPSARHQDDWAGFQSADLRTLRERMFKLDPDEHRQTPRSAALTHVLSLIKWGWDDQIEGHRGLVNKMKEMRRTRVQQEVRFAQSNTTPTLAPSAPPSAPLALRRPRGNSADYDAMDIDS